VPLGYNVMDGTHLCRRAIINDTHMCRWAIKDGTYLCSWAIDTGFENMIPKIQLKAAKQLKNAMKVMSN